MGNQRNFFRIDLDNSPLYSDMTIVEVKGKSIYTNKTHVLVDNLSAGGLRFISSLKLTASTDIILEFKITLLNQHVRLFGYPVRVTEMADGLYQTGVIFTIDEQKQDQMVRLCNELTMRMRRAPHMIKCAPFYTGEPVDFFRTPLVAEM